MLAIDHCREGRMECKAGKDTFSYVTAGNIKLDSRQTHTGEYSAKIFGRTIPRGLKGGGESWQDFFPDISGAGGNGKEVQYRADRHQAVP